MSNNSHLDIDQKILGDCYSSSEAMDNLTILCDDFGSRFGGTEGERQSVEFMVEKLESYGLKVHTEEFPYTAWTRGDNPVLEILSPIQKNIPIISLPHSPPADLEATLIDLGDGAPEDFERRAAEIKGKVVMANSVTFPEGSKRWVHRSEKFGRSMLAGATGFIFMNHYPAYGPATGGIGSGKGEEAIMPGISVSYEDGSFLQRLVKKSGEVKIRIKTTDKSWPATSWNIVAELPGSDAKPEVVMLGSHYDGHDISQGAQDPASGAVAVMEAARLLATHSPSLPCTVRFVLWGVEEIGLLGSRAYAERHSDELGNMRFYFNMDGAGSVQNKGVVLNEWAALEPLIEGWRDNMAHNFGIQQSFSAHSDHYPFLLKGVPTGGLESVPKSTGGRGYGHTRYDTLDKVTLRELQDASAMAARLALRFASEPDWPVEQRSQAAIAEIMSEPKYGEVKEIMDEVGAYHEANKGK